MFLIVKPRSQGELHIWILDDITPLRELSSSVAGESAHLFSLQPAYRYRYHGSFEEGPRRGSGENPPKGAIINYTLKHKPNGDITLEIVDGKGSLVDKFSSKPEPEEPADPGEYSDEAPKRLVLTTHVGVNRVVWNLMYPGATPIKKAKADQGEPKVGPMVLPGAYTARLTVEGKTYSSPLEVKFDPRMQRDGNGPAARDEIARADMEGIEAQIKLALQVRDDITRISNAVERLRTVRKQLAERNELLKDNPSASELAKASKDLVAKLDALEEKLHNPKAQVSYDILAMKGGAKLYSQLVWLYNLLLDSDGSPTQGVKEVYAEQAGELRKLESDLNTLFDTDVAHLNSQAKQIDVPGVIVPRPGSGATKK